MTKKYLLFILLLVSARALLSGPGATLCMNLCKCAYKQATQKVSTVPSRVSKKNFSQLRSSSGRGGLRSLSPRLFGQQ
jgi:hypothetical protein